MKQIPLTGGFVAIVDDEDYPIVARHAWQVRGAPDHPYAVTRINRKHTMMHRYIMGQACRGSVVDYRDGNTLDNRRANLRVTSTACNARNRRQQRGSASPFKGVHRATASCRWRAMIQYDGRPIHIGSFSTPEEAALAYDDTARRLHGEFACVNFPRPGERPALIGAIAV